MIALHALLSSARDDHTPVCRHGVTVCDFAAFRTRVFTIARAVTAKQDERITRYALCIEDPFDFVSALFALLACGKEPVIPAYSTPGYLADLAYAYDALLTDEDIVMMSEPTEGEVVSEIQSKVVSSLDQCASLTIFTSGSSGTPKPIRKTLAQLNAEVHTLEAEWGAVLAGTTVLCSVPHRHMYGLTFRLLWPLAAGRPFTRTLCTEPSQLQEALTQCAAVLLVSTPAVLSRWPMMPGFFEMLPKPCRVFSAGSVLSAATAAHYVRAFGAAPIDVYGSTEAGVIAWRSIDKSDLWQPFAGVDVRLGANDVLEIRSPHLEKGESAATLAVAHQGINAHWTRTDDIVSFETNGGFRLTGRHDRVIKIAGKRASLTEIETRLASHPYVQVAAAVALDKGARRYVGVVAVLTEAGSDALHREGRAQFTRILRRHLAAHLEAVMLPRHWRVRLALPVDTRGKLPVADLVAMFAVDTHGPEVLAEMRCGDALLYDLRVPPTLAHFAGHFPGMPILPGVVQVGWAIRFSAHRHAEPASGTAVPHVGHEVASIDRLKFTAPVRPGARLMLTLKHDAARGRTSFVYRSGKRDCASGVIVYRAN